MPTFPTKDSICITKTHTIAGGTNNLGLVMNGCRGEYIITITNTKSLNTVNDFCYFVCLVRIIGFKIYWHFINFNKGSQFKINLYSIVRERGCIQSGTGKTCCQADQPARRWPGENLKTASLQRGDPRRFFCGAGLYVAVLLLWLHS